MDDEGMRGILGGMTSGSSGPRVSCVGRGKGKSGYISFLRLTIGVAMTWTPWPRTFRTWFFGLS